MQVRVLRLGLRQDGGIQVLNYWPRDHASHVRQRATLEHRSQPAPFKQIPYAQLWIGHLQSAFCPSRMYINTNKRPETGTTDVVYIRQGSHHAFALVSRLSWNGERVPSLR
jgi:hypothetical protein